MGGKGSVASPPSTDYSSLAVMEMESALSKMQAQSQATLAGMTFGFQQSMIELLAGMDESATEAPAITEYDVNWDATIAELEAAAYEDIANLTSWGSASGTQVSNPILWEEEPNVIYKSLLGS